MWTHLIPIIQIQIPNQYHSMIIFYYYDHDEIWRLVEIWIMR